MTWSEGMTEHSLALYLHLDIDTDTDPPCTPKWTLPWTFPFCTFFTFKALTFCKTVTVSLKKKADLDYQEPERP